MHFYQFHIGDYASHTQHLDPLEDIAYRRMIDWCYLNESPLPKDIKEIARIIRMREECERIANVLREFWSLESGLYFQKRIKEETEKYKDKSTKAKNAAEARWSKEASKQADLGDADALQTHCRRNANQEPLTKNQEPLTNNHKHITYTSESSSSASQSDPVPYKKIIDLYHRKLPQLPAVQKITKARQAAIRQRWKSGDLPALENWENFFDYISQSQFLMGKAPTYGDKRPFVANLEWVTKESNYTKILEGRYHGV